MLTLCKLYKKNIIINSIIMTDITSPVCAVALPEAVKQLDNAEATQEIIEEAFAIDQMAQSNNREGSESSTDSVDIFEGVDESMKEKILEVYNRTAFLNHDIHSDAKIKVSFEIFEFFKKNYPELSNRLTLLNIEDESAKQTCINADEVKDEEIERSNMERVFEEFDNENNSPNKSKTAQDEVKDNKKRNVSFLDGYRCHINYIDKYIRPCTIDYAFISAEVERILNTKLTSFCKDTTKESNETFLTQIHEFLTNHESIFSILENLFEESKQLFESFYDKHQIFPCSNNTLFATKDYFEESCKIMNERRNILYSLLTRNILNLTSNEIEYQLHWLSIDNSKLMKTALSSRVRLQDSMDKLTNYGFLKSVIVTELIEKLLVIQTNIEEIYNVATKMEKYIESVNPTNKHLADLVDDSLVD
jgi:hypothetical protein